ncbi:type II toxin-antitoxin system HicB family antitoxin [Desulfovirgula thermocuniculi]|uniref:type II toxin-antitoxin system HicB family antitoxin n=1 Tax=Desulfovirgula thermocuniculi TaxID=348842 RepID=UPI000416E4F5|nr:toxin-antitoxin system HicB family antitoxin [Desulfovirgula thermocuniculi]
MNKGLEYYLRLPYRVVIYPSPEGGYVAEVPDLPGCLTQSETLEELMEMVEDAKRCWIADALERGEEVPEPVDESYSGRILVRAPKSLHRALAEKAREEGVSLNQYIVYQLSRAVGLR